MVDFIYDIVPKFEWIPFRENFISRRYRPAILTLGSIFATFRVLKSAKEMADAFFTIGEVLGYYYKGKI
jgi:hypothetical protein